MVLIRRKEIPLVIPIRYAMVEQFITHIVERELQNFDDAQSDEDIKKKLQGLGYIS